MAENTEIHGFHNSFRRVKVLSGYAAHARFLAELDDELIGYVPHQIPSPHRYNPVHAVNRWRGRGKHVIVVETAHRRYEVYQVIAGPVLTTDEDATRIYIASQRKQGELT